MKTSPFIFVSLIYLLMNIAPSASGQTTIKTNAIDPYHVKEFTLKNGLKVFISTNKTAPRIQTMIAVKAGSKFDPTQTTGLAHYLEHMMFKGTHRYGTIDWNKEKLQLDKIAALYEDHLNEKDEAKKKAIYHLIDSMSFEASKLAVPSEYDKMVASIGASGTNAFTSNDMTVYVNEIPSNSLDKWAKLEGERFSTLVLRLFHTELETVYEEFNRNQDDDIRWSNFAIDSMLMPNHPYGTQTTIGLGEHLKNPSMINIHNYFDKYYVPNNMAVILCGDVDEKIVLPILENTLGKLTPKVVAPFVKQPAVTINKVQEKEIFGPTKEHVYIGFRFDGDGTKESMTAKVLDMILSNGGAGLLDLNLVQKQKVLTASSYVSDLKDYSVFKIYAEPKTGQRLEEARDLLLSQIDLIKQGNFDETILKANVDNLRLQRLQSIESNRSRAYSIMDAFVKDVPWSYHVNELDEMAKITKQDIVEFANKHLNANYAVCYKRIGEPNRHKVEKPVITPVQLNKDSISAFKKEFDAIAQGNNVAKFVDFNKDITHLKLDRSGDFQYIKNEEAPIFSLNLTHYLGTDNIKELGLAADYANYLGTKDISAGELKTKFYKLGLSYKLSVGRDRFTVSLSGLEENLKEGIELALQVMQNYKPEKEVFQNLQTDLLKKRANAKLNKGVILTQAMMNYAKYGKTNPFTNMLSAEELKNTDPSALTDLLKSLAKTPDKITYYGHLPAQEAYKIITDPLNKINTTNKPVPEAKKFPELKITKPIVYFCNYDMRQAEVIMLSQSSRFNKEWLPYIRLYNDYYGSGLSSIMFQEVREKMALAYAVSSSFGVPNYKDDSHYITSYVGTQVDKLETALNKMDNLLGNMVVVPKQFDGAKSSIVRNLESDWVTGEGVFGLYDQALKRGLTTDVRKEVYSAIKQLNINDLKTFFDTNVKGRARVYLVIGNKDKINFDLLKKTGEVKELSLEEVFGY